MLSNFNPNSPPPFVPITPVSNQNNDDDDTDENGLPMINATKYLINYNEKFKNEAPILFRDATIHKILACMIGRFKPNALLKGAAGTGKTKIVEDIARRIANNDVLIPPQLKDYTIWELPLSNIVAGSSLVGDIERKIKSIIDFATDPDNKVILFIDEVHTLIGGASDGPMDLANILKPALDRGDVKAIGATTTEEYETYVIRDRAFLRRFDRIDVLEPDHATTVKILVGTIPRIAAKTGAKFKYTDFVVEELMDAIVGATSEYKRVYGLAAMYPDVALSVLSQAFSNALFENRREVNVLDVYNAIKNSKRIYPDAIIK